MSKTRTYVFKRICAPKIELNESWASRVHLHKNIIMFFLNILEDIRIKKASIEFAFDSCS